MAETRFFVSLILFWLMSCVGCGDGGGKVPVEGVITLDGKPLASVNVTFDQPDLGPSENKAYVGRTDTEGRFVLRPMMEEGDGVVPGEYRVSLTTAVYDPSAPSQPAGPQTKTTFFPESPPTPPERIPPAYRGGKLTFTVPPDGTDAANFELKSK